MGVKAGPNGQYIVSSGNQTLDQVIGGGLIVGSLNVMYEDHVS